MNDKTTGDDAAPLTMAKKKFQPTGISLLVKVANRYSVEPTKLLDTLKATAFKVKTSGGGDIEVTNEQMMALLIVADQYGLNPFTKEIFAFPQKGGGIVPVVGVDGWARIINEHPQMDGLSFDWPDNAAACTCTIYRKDRGHPISVTEFLSECKRGTEPWGSHPRRMLRHKALIQCARLAFGFAGIYDKDEAERIVSGGTIDGETGEIIDMPKTSSIEAVRDAAKKKREPKEKLDAELQAASEATAQAAQAASPFRAERLTPAELQKHRENIKNAGDAEVAMLVLDEAAGMHEDDEKALRATFDTRWPAAGK